MTIERTSTSAARSTDYDRVDDRDDPTTTSSTSRAAREYDGGGAIATRAQDADILAFVQNQKKTPSPNDEIVHLGMNREAAAAEATKLSKHAKVTEVGHGKVGGKSINMESPEGRAAFVGMLRERGIGAKQADAILAAVVQTNPTGVDEMANLALIWAKGERGESIPSRLVISGHSSGTDVWDGGGDGEIAFADVRRLALAMPRAAAQIEDLHISACQTGSQLARPEERGEWMRAFPNLKTAWSYAGSAPTRGGAHLDDWAKATAGRADRLALTGARSQGAVGVWDRADGYRDGAEPIGVARARQAAADKKLDGWVSGAEVPKGPDDAEITNAYRAYKAMARRADVPQGEREQCEAKGHQLLCIRFYDASIRGELGKRYNAQLGNAFKSVGLPPPDFKAMSRKEAVAAIEAFERAAANAKGVEGALSLAQKIKNLAPDTVHATWCRH